VSGVWRGLDTPPKHLQSIEIIDSLARNTDDGGQNSGQDAVSPVLLHRRDPTLRTEAPNAEPTAK
jgi:hypothetical protein